MNTKTAQENQVKGTHLSHAAGAVLVCVMLLGLWQFAESLSQIGEMTYPKSWVDFREGRTTGALEKQLDQKMPMRSNLIAGANSLRYLLLNGANDQVRVGKDGWLFLTDEIRFDIDGDKNMQTRTNLLSTVSYLLEQKGVKLVVLLVPDKARVHSDRLMTGQYPDANESRYVRTVAQLADKKVTVIDILTPLRKQVASAEVYYRTDTHWNQLGAKIAAQEIASAVGRMRIPLQKTTFGSKADAVLSERQGDLIGMIGMESVPSFFRPRSDHEAAVTTAQTSSDQLTGLFGETGIDVVLTGTSYSLRGNFHGFLQEALSTKVLNGAKDGGGLLQATKQYLTDDAFKTAKPKILIWEIPERFIQAKLDGEETALVEFGLISPQ